MAELAERDVYEGQLARAIARVQAARLRDLVEKAGDPPDPTKIPPGWHDETDALIEQAVEPILTAAYLASAAQVQAEQPAAYADEISSQALAWSGAYAAELARNIGETTRTNVEQAIRKVVELALGVAALREALAYTFGPVRAATIAITEVTVAAIAGEEAAVSVLKKLGVTVEDVWETAQDERVCPVCSPRHGKKRGDGWTDNPPLHPRCRCSITRRYGR